MTALMVEIIGDASKLNKATTDATSHAEGLTGKLRTVGTGMVIGAGIGAFNLLSGAISTGISKLGEAHEAFLKDASSQLLLAKALENNIPNWDGNVNGAEKYAAAQMRLGFADDEVRASLGQLVGVTHNLFEAQQLNNLAQDLARAKGIDLAQASDIVTKAYQGNGKALKGLGIDIEGAKTGAELLAAAQRNVSGSAETWAATNEGKLAASNLKVGEAMEKVGGIVDKVSQVVVPIFADVLTNLVDVLGEVWDAVQPVISTIAKGLQPVIERIGPIAKTIFEGIKSVVQSVAPVFGSIFGAIGNVVTVFVGLFQGAMNTVGGVINWVIGAFSFMGNIISNIWNAVAGAVKGAINGVIGAINGIIARINSVQVHIHLDLPDPLPNINFDWYGLRLGSLPYLHAGGIVPGVPGSDQLAILQAGERVLPMNEASGGGNITVNFYGPVYGDDMEDLARKLAFRLRTVGG